MLLFTWENGTRLDILSIFWFEQRLDKHVTKCFIRVLFRRRVVLFLWVQSLVFFCKFIDRNLSDDKGEIFRTSVFLGGNVALVGKFELSLLVEHICIVLFDSIFAIFFFFFTVFWFLLGNYFLK
jgi:hypothetical protein